MILMFFYFFLPDDVNVLHRSLYAGLVWNWFVQTRKDPGTIYCLVIPQP